MSPKNKSKIIGLIVIVLLVAATTGAVIWYNNNEVAKQPDRTVQSDPTTPYKDGTYAADGEYRSPGGNEKIGVTVTLTDSVITNVSIKTFGVETAAQYQSAFKDGISEVVVGKKVDEVNVSRVSSSSLTSTGFNRALETIRREAKV